MALPCLIRASIGQSYIDLFDISIWFFIFLFVQEIVALSLNRVIEVIDVLISPKILLNSERLPCFGVNSMQHKTADDDQIIISNSTMLFLHATDTHTVNPLTRNTTPILNRAASISASAVSGVVGHNIRVSSEY